MTRPILITGGAGFIGANVADRLASACSLATLSTVLCSPEPMLKTPPSASGLSSASRKARATSRTWTKSRRCWPSSNTIGAWPLAMREAKIASTPV